jgi:predicted naringenin-chalcone synthase
MAWNIGDDGFDIVLSSYVPDLIHAHIRPAIENWLAAQSLKLEDVTRWAVHPGGRAILDKISSALSLPPDALNISRALLRDAGNLSSATMCFVLERTLNGLSGRSRQHIFAAAFGPGLTVEMGLFTPYEK